MFLKNASFWLQPHTQSPTSERRDTNRNKTGIVLIGTSYNRGISVLLSSTVIKYPWTARSLTTTSQGIKRPKVTAHRQYFLWPVDDHWWLRSAMKEITAFLSLFRNNATRQSATHTGETCTLDFLCYQCTADIVNVTSARPQTPPFFESLMFTVTIPWDTVTIISTVMERTDI